MGDPVTRAVAVLNDALERDPEAITALINMRVECGEALASHPTIQVGVYGGVHRVGVLGLINGALGESPSGVIGAQGRMDGETGRFLKVRKFVDLRLEKVDFIA